MIESVADACSFIGSPSCKRRGQCQDTLVESWGPSYAACRALGLLGSLCVGFVQGGFSRGCLGAELSPRPLAPLPHPGAAGSVAWPIPVGLEISPAVWERVRRSSSRVIPQHPSQSAGFGFGVGREQEFIAAAGRAWCVNRCWRERQTRVPRGSP